MNKKINEQTGKRSFLLALSRPRLSTWALLPIAAVLLAANLSAQLKSTQYAQPPSVVVEPLIVKLSGVYPQKIVRPQGPFLLYVENRLPGHAGHFSLTLDQANAAELTGLDTASAQPRSTILLDLLPGTYRLHIQTQGNNPVGWSVVIQITN